MQGGHFYLTAWTSSFPKIRDGYFLSEPLVFLLNREGPDQTPLSGSILFAMVQLSDDTQQEHNDQSTFNQRCSNGVSTMCSQCEGINRSGTPTATVYAH